MRPVARSKKKDLRKLSLYKKLCIMPIFERNRTIYCDSDSHTYVLSVFHMMRCFCWSFVVQLKLKLMFRDRKCCQKIIEIWVFL
jgi:hypothetical protein